MGLFGRIFQVVGFLVLVLVGLGAYMYFTDHEMEASVTEKGRDAEGHYVVVTPKLVPFDVRHNLDAQSAPFVCEGYHVTYRLQSGHTAIFDAQGRLVWDSSGGLNNALRAVLSSCP